MQKELIEFIVKNGLSQYNKNKTQIKEESESVFKTRDAKAIFNKTLGQIARHFYFADTSCLLESFRFTDSAGEIKMRQTFFSDIPKTIKNEFLAEIKFPETSWKPKYDIVAVTENEKTFIELKKINVPVKFLTSEEDVIDLEQCDIVQAVDCENFQPYLEQLNQIIFINNPEDVYLERYVELISSWKKNIEVLEKNEAGFEIKTIIEELKPLLALTSEAKTERLSRDFVENSLGRINENISERIKNISISGMALFEMLSKNSLSKELMDIIYYEIEATGI